MKGKQNYIKGDWRIFLVLILCEPCLYFIFEGYALKYTSASQAGMLVSTLPIFVGIFGFFLLKEKIAVLAGWVVWLQSVVPYGLVWGQWLMNMPPIPYWVIFLNFAPCCLLLFTRFVCDALPVTILLCLSLRLRLGEVRCFFYPPCLFPGWAYQWTYRAG